MHPVDVSSKSPRTDDQQSGSGAWVAVIGLIAIVALVVVALVAMSDGEADQPPAEQPPIDAPIDPVP
jgi:hypothetical protein